MSVRTSLLALFVAVLLASCASKPVTIETAKPVSPHKQFKYSKKSKARNALLSFVRENGFVGSTCASRITVNGEKVGEVGTGKIINIYLKPGRHKVTIAPTNMKLCGGTKKDTVIRLGKNKEKHFKIAMIQKLDMSRIQKAPVDP